MKGRKEIGRGTNPLLTALSHGKKNGVWDSQWKNEQIDGLRLKKENKWIKEKNEQMNEYREQWTERWIERKNENKKMIGEQWTERWIEN